ncbi:unnamed protein product [Orchesella dallaii]|uniref:Large ribosomal subunit protein uL4m n=1 Tax=Orchesella dallaii TaxID=48710 RepID=A0ABP1PL91_9HEXA
MLRQICTGRLSVSSACCSVILSLRGLSPNNVVSRSASTISTLVDSFTLKKKSEDIVPVVTEDVEVETGLARGPLPLITHRELNYLPFGRASRQAWMENLDTIEEQKLGLVDLHPDVFGTFPRIEIIQSNMQWQMLYKKVNWTFAPSRAELPGSQRKPWPQKGTGRARHGHRKAPQWHGGGKPHGPRGPKSYYYMLPFDKRLHGLCSMLSVKHAQDDLKIVDTLDIPTDDPKYMEDLVDKRKWGVSVLFVDDTDIAPKNLALATDSIGHMNIMPVYGLNVYSMLKHETLVLSLAALNKIEEKLVFHLNRHNPRPPTARKIHKGSFIS